VNFYFETGLICQFLKYLNFQLDFICFKFQGVTPPSLLSTSPPPEGAPAKPCRSQGWRRRGLFPEPGGVSASGDGGALASGDGSGFWRRRRSPLRLQPMQICGLVGWGEGGAGARRGRGRRVRRRSRGSRHRSALANGLPSRGSSRPAGNRAIGDGCVASFRI